MKKTVLIAAGLGLMWSTLLAAEAKRPVDWVNPTIETNRGRWFFCTPGSRPFGMVASAPHTVNKNQDGGGYVYSENDIKGFTQIHGWMMGGLNVMPTTGSVDPTQYEQWNSSFSHDTEVIKPGYQKVFLDRYKTWVELTSTDRVALYRYKFTESNPADILMVMGGRVGSVTMAGAAARKINEQEIEGQFSTILRQWGGPGDVKVFFVIQFSEPFDGLDGWIKEQRLQDISELKADPVTDEERFILSRREVRDRWGDPTYHAGMSARYNVKAGDELVVKIGISYTSIENARHNLTTECPHWNFDQVVQASFDEWNDWLGKIKVKGGSDQLKTKFYTDLWHALLGRHKIDDVSGDYPDRTKALKQKGERYFTEFQVKTVPKDEDGKPLFHMYNSDSWWHSFWNLNILWGLAWPEVTDEMSASMMQYARNHLANGGQGTLPRGPCGGGYTGIMNGCSAVPLIASTYQKGLLTKASADDALELMKRNFTKEDVPVEKAGITVLYGFEVWTMAQMAKDLGDQKTYDFFEERSRLWTPLYRPDQKLLFSRNPDGSWVTDDPKWKNRQSGWTESNSWVGTWGVSHDLPRLAQLMGGPAEAAKKLNSGFEDSAVENFTGSYGTRAINFGNETGHCNAHVFNYFAHPWLSQYWVRQVSTQTFGGTDPDHGYGGHDEDQGKTGAVSALMKLGLYSIRGTSSSEPIYEMTTPEFEEVTIKLDPTYYSGKEFKIKCYDQKPENMYIQKARLNGKMLENCWIYHKDFAKGGLLELWLGPKPNKSWGVKELP